MKFHKSIDVIDSNSSDGSGKSKMKNIHDSWKEVKISTFTRVWKKLISSLTEDFEVFRSSTKAITSDKVEIAKSSSFQSGAWSCEWIVAILLKNMNRWGLASYAWTKKLVSWDGVHPRWKCCDYWHYNKVLQELLDKAGVGFNVWLHFWRSSTKYKDECHSEFVPERKNQSRWQTSLLC